MSDRQSALTHAMIVVVESISEDTYAAGWYSGIEYLLWEAVLGRGTRHFDAADLDALRALSSLTGHWVRFGADGPEAVPLKTWEALYDSWTWQTASL